MTALIIGLGTAVLAAFAALFLPALIAAPRDMARKDLLRVYPDLICLLVALAKDKRVAGLVRWRLLAALAYNVQPINLIPDFIPIVGLADNVIISAWAVRSAIRKSGAEVVMCHWRGSPATFALVCRLCRLAPAHEPVAWNEVAASMTSARPGPEQHDLVFSASSPGGRSYALDHPRPQVAKVQQARIPPIAHDM